MLSRSHYKYLCYCIYLYITCYNSITIVVSGCNNAISNAKTPANMCAYNYANDLSTPRGLYATSQGSLVVLEQGAARLTLLRDVNQNNIIDNNSQERFVLATASNINHGLAVQDNFIFASSPTTVFRWPFDQVQQHNNPSSLGSPTIIIQNIPGDGHNTRTIIFDAQKRLYVTIGSIGNVDNDSSHALIRRFTVFGNNIQFPINWSSGEIVAHGMRNMVGLGYDPDGSLWGVENGADNLERSDIGGSVYPDNPAEEVNSFPDSNFGKFYGYPYCFSEYKLPAQYSRGAGSQWVWPSFSNTYSDQWCRNTSNVVPPAFSLQAHTAPLGILFYSGTFATNKQYSLPSEYTNDAIVCLHGSWNRPDPVGYSVVRLHFNSSRIPYAVSDLFAYQGPGAKGSDWGYRPVEARIGNKGEIYFTSDASGQVVALRYNATGPINNPTSSGVKNQFVQSSLILILCLIFIVFVY